MNKSFSLILVAIVASSQAQYPQDDYFEAHEPLSAFARVARGGGYNAEVEILPAPAQPYANQQIQDLPNYGGASIIEAVPQEQPFPGGGYGGGGGFQTNQNQEYSAPVVPLKPIGGGYGGGAPIKEPYVNPSPIGGGGYGGGGGSKPLKPVPSGYGGGGSQASGGFNKPSRPHHHQHSGSGYNSGSGISFGGGWSQGGGAQSFKPQFQSPYSAQQQQFPNNAQQYGGQNQDSYARPPQVLQGTPLSPPSPSAPTGYGR